MAIRLADAWRLPDLVKKSIRGVETYDTDDPGNPANAVRFANALAKLAGVHAGPFEAPAVERDVQAGRQLFVLSDREVHVLTDGLRERVDERLF